MKKFFTQVFIGAMLIVSISAEAQNGLFISEVTDPGDEYTGRFIELFNAGSESVDFTNTVFYLTRQSNGGTTWGEVQLTGTIAAGACYVIGGSAFESFYGFAPDLVTGILTGNGNDPYSLYEGGGHVSGMLHDIFGDTDTDGTGELWEYTDSRAVRVSDVEDPRILWSAAEWDITPADIADCDPGTHNGSTPVDPPDPGDFVLQIINDTVDLGQYLELAVVVSELLTEDDVISYQFDIEYDQSVIMYNGSSLNGTLAEGGTIVDNEAIAGMVSVSYMSTTPIIGAGEILILQFQSLAIEETELSLLNAYLNNIPVINLTSGRAVIVETAPPTAVITYGSTENRLADMLMITATFSEPMDIANSVWLSLNGAAILTNAVMTRLSDTTYAYLYPIPNSVGIVNVRLSNGTDLWGNEVVAIPTSGATFTIIGLRLGDVNDDGEIQAYDAALSLQHSVGLDPLPEFDPLPWENWRDSTANVDGVAGITAYDASLILQYSAGIISGFPAGSKKSVSIADVSVRIEDNYIVFYSSGDLFGLNVSIINENQMFDVPTILLDNSGFSDPTGFLSALNIDGSIYNVGLCTSSSPLEGAAILKIPFQKSGLVTLDMIINTEERSETINLSTGIVELEQELIAIYPNPVSDVLKISGLNGSVVADIFTIQGTRISSVIIEAAGEINVSDLSSGVYIIRLETEGENVVRRFLKR